LILGLLSVDGPAGGSYGQTFSDMAPGAPSSGTNDIFQPSTNGDQI